MARVTLMPVKPNIQPSDRKLTHDGCRFSPSCLDCPLPRCKDEMTAAEMREYRRRKLRERIMDAFARNRSANPSMAPFWVEWLTAREAGVSSRTVARTLARAE